MSRSEAFIESIIGALPAKLDDGLKLRAKCALLDYIGVTLAGAKVQSSEIERLIGSFAGERGSIYPVGLARPMGINCAVFLNGLNGHVLDFDDGTNAGIIHLGSPVFSVLLALAQNHNISGLELLRAAVVGYETSFTMAMTIQPEHKRRGYHATGTCGTLGSAVAAALALGYLPAEIKRAFSIAAVSATGTLKVLEDGSQLKPFNAAKAALAGLIAVQMAGAGFETPDDVLSGTAGFLSQMYGTDDIPMAKPRLQGTYAIEKAYIKPYAACRYTHPAIDVARALRQNARLQADEIRSVRIKTYSLAVKNHDHIVIQGASSAKMSIPYSFSVAYLTGKTGIEAFLPSCVEDSEVLALTRKVQVEADPVMTDAFPEKTIAEVILTAADGKTYTGRSELPKGEPENPMSVDETVEKFMELVLYSGRSRERAEEIRKAVFSVEEDLPRLLELLR